LKSQAVNGLINGVSRGFTYKCAMSDMGAAGTELDAASYD